MKQQDYTAAQGARFVLGGLMILFACLCETVVRVVGGILWALWRYKVEIALGIASVAFCLVVPYVLAGIAFIMLG